MPKRLIPIDVGSKPHESLSNLIARIAALGPKMDVFCGNTSIGIIVAFDKYYNNEITLEELCTKLDSLVLP